MSLLSLYYSQNYTKTCPEPSGTFFLTTPESLSIGAKIVGCFGIPANFLAYYLIIFHTPEFMKHLKGCLLHLKVWTLLIDLVYTVFLIPFVFYPICAMGYIGIFTNIFGIPSEIQFYLAMCCYGGISSAGILLFENRQHYMIPEGYRFRIQNPIFRSLLVVFNGLLGVSIAMVAFWLRSDSEELKFKFLKLNPCPSPLYFSPQTFAVDTNRNELSIAIVTVLSLVFLQYTFFFSHCVIYIYSEEAGRYSRTTRKMQKMFLLASFTQLLIFVAVIVVPLGVFAVVLTMRVVVSQALLNICNLIIPTIGINTTGALIIMYKPYRNYMLNLFNKNKKKNDNLNSVFSKTLAF